MTLSNLDILNPNEDNFDELISGKRISPEVIDFFYDNIMQAKAEDGKDIKALRLEQISELMQRAKSTGAVQTMLFAIRLKDVVEKDILVDQLSKYVAEVNAEVTSMQSNDLGTFAKAYETLEKAYREITDKYTDVSAPLSREFSVSEPDLAFVPRKVSNPHIKTLSRSSSDSDLSDTEDAVDGAAMRRASKMSNLDEIAGDHDAIQLNRDMMHFAAKHYALKPLYALYMMKEDAVGVLKAVDTIKGLDLYNDQGIFADFYRSIRKAAGFDKELLFQMKAKLVLQIVEQGGFSDEALGNIFETLGWNVLDQFGDLDQRKKGFEKSFEEVQKFVSELINEGNLSGLKLLMQVQYFKDFVNAVRDDIAQDVRGDREVAEILLPAIIDNLYDFKFANGYSDEYNDYVSLYAALGKIYEEYGIPKSELNVALATKALNEGHDNQLRILSGINNWNPADVVKQLIIKGLFNKEMAAKVLANDYLEFTTQEASEIGQMHSSKGFSYTDVLSGKAELLKFYLLASSERSAWQIYKHESGVSGHLSTNGTKDVYSEYKQFVSNHGDFESFKQSFYAVKWQHDLDDDGGASLEGFYNYMLFLTKAFGHEEHNQFVRDDKHRVVLEESIRDGDLVTIEALMAEEGYSDTVARDPVHYVQFVANNNPDEVFLGKLGITDQKVLWEVLNNFAAEDNAFMVKFITEGDLLFDIGENTMYERVLKKAAEAGAFNVFIDIWEKSPFDVGDLEAKGIYTKMTDGLKEQITEYLARDDESEYEGDDDAEVALDNSDGFKALIEGPVFTNVAAMRANALDSPMVIATPEADTAFVIDAQMAIPEDNEVFYGKSPSGLSLSPLDGSGDGENLTVTGRAFFGANLEVDKIINAQRTGAIEVAPTPISAYDGFGDEAPCAPYSNPTEAELLRAASRASSTYDTLSFADDEEEDVLVGNFDEASGMITSPRVTKFGTFSSSGEDPDSAIDTDTGDDDAYVSQTRTKKLIRKLPAKLNILEEDDSAFEDESGPGTGEYTILFKPTKHNSESDVLTNPEQLVKLGGEADDSAVTAM